jgi:hypothetical protein
LALALTAERRNRGIPGLGTFHAAHDAHRTRLPIPPEGWPPSRGRHGAYHGRPTPGTPDQHCGTAREERNLAVPPPPTTTRCAPSGASRKREYASGCPIRGSGRNTTAPCATPHSPLRHGKHWDQQARLRIVDRGIFNSGNRSGLPVSQIISRMRWS